jgi:hypothetical protein
MSQIGNAKYSRRAHVFRSTLNIRHSTARLARPFRAKTGREQMQQLRLRKGLLFDHLVGAGEQARRHGEA